MTTTVNMHAAKTQLSKLVDKVCHGEDVVIARDGKPVVRLVLIDDKLGKKRPLGLHAGKVTIHDNFDAPLPDDFMKAFE